MLNMQIPTFEEFVLHCKKLNLHPYIELKAPITDEQIDIVYSIVKKLGIFNKVTWLGDFAYMAKIVAKNSKTHVVWVTSNLTDIGISHLIILKTGENEVVVNLDHNSVTQETSDKLMDEGISLECYTVNSTATLVSLFEMVVTRITTDGLNIAKILNGNLTNHRSVIFAKIYVIDIFKGEYKMGKFKRLVIDSFLNGICNSVLIHPRYRYKLYGFFKLDIKKSRIRSGCVFDGNNIKIGKGCFINRNCHFDSNEKITIGENVYFGAESMLLTSSHKIGGQKKRADHNYDLPITIENGSWIGARATILQGVTIGEGCIIGAGSLVNKDCDPNGLYVGTPAKRVKDLSVL